MFCLAFYIIGILMWIMIWISFFSVVMVTRGFDETTCRSITPNIAYFLQVTFEAMHSRERERRGVESLAPYFTSLIYFRFSLY